IGLKGGLILWSVIAMLLFLRGVYEFSKLWVDQESAGWAVILAVFSTSFTEAMHIFGQLPSITGIALLLNACPELYKWIRSRKSSHLIFGLALLALTSCTHHVTTIFGLVFFIFPVLGLAVIDNAQEKKINRIIHIRDFLAETWKSIPRVILLSISIVVLTIIVIFPYWYWSKSDPITQVPIPHGSRDSFIEVLSSGLVFFVIPWGMMLFFLPFLFFTIWKKRNIFIGISISLLFVLGTGGTTPVPRLMLGENAFNILTLDRFTYWATILSLPFWGLFMAHLLKIIKNKLTPYRNLYRFILGFIFTGTIICCILTTNFRYFVNTQPDKIDIDPIVSFLNVDQHYKWRYLTLGFGDQMAWLSANTNALSVDGNYHSVRRLSEMTSRAVERLENAKYLGDEGLEALRQFLTLPEKFNLKYIFSNDKFYDPLLFYSGWMKVQQLDNNIIIWERPDVNKLPIVLPEKNIPGYQKMMWGLIPVSCFFLCLFVLLFNRRSLLSYKGVPEKSPLFKAGSYTLMFMNGLWAIILAIVILASGLIYYYNNDDRTSPENLVNAYFNALDYKDFQKAYALIDPDQRPDWDEYQVQLSLQTGILSSYAKLKNIDIRDLHPISKDRYKASINAEWTTSLMEYNSEHDLELIKKGLFWYLVPMQPEPYIPPDKLTSIPVIDRHKHGKRKLNTSRLLHEDIIDRPEVVISQARLVKHEDNYFIIGEAINVDNDPAFLVLEGVLYDSSGQEIIRHGTTDMLNHHLAPWQKTNFRIDFAPALKTKELFDSIAPASIEIFARTTVTDFQGYMATGYSNVEYESGQISGEFHNYGTEVVLIPQVQLGYYNDKDELFWLEKIYLPEGVLQQRSKAFKHHSDQYHSVSVLYDAMLKDLYVNGKNMNESLYYRRAKQEQKRSLYYDDKDASVGIE
ncbi:MAG: hypothetical protein HKN67_01150, partial [Saprospiraceae bacterium]|nr:hypothetical protein [Saprospiraceae bacterium]